MVDNPHNTFFAESTYLNRKCQKKIQVKVAANEMKNISGIFEKIGFKFFNWPPFGFKKSEPPKVQNKLLELLFVFVNHFCY